MVLHNAHNNPLMRVAAWVLQEDAAARAKQDETGGFGWDPISKTDDERWAPGAFVAPRLHRIHLRFRLALLLTARPELRSLRRRTGTWGDELKLPPTEGGARGASGTSENPVERYQVGL